MKTLLNQSHAPYRINNPATFFIVSQFIDCLQYLIVSAHWLASIDSAPYFFRLKIVSIVNIRNVMPDSQRYPWNLYLINYVEGYGHFPSLKAFDSDNFCVFSSSQNVQIMF